MDVPFLCVGCKNNLGGSCNFGIVNFPYRKNCGSHAVKANVPVVIQGTLPKPASVPPPPREPIERIVSATNPNKALRYCKLP